MIVLIREAGNKPAKECGGTRIRFFDKQELLCEARFFAANFKDDPVGIRLWIRRYQITE